MSKRSTRCLCLCLLALSLIGSVQAMAADKGAPQDQPLTPREKELLQVIDNLTQRLDEVEKKVQDLERAVGAPPTPDLAQRIVKVEEKLDTVAKKSDTAFKVYWKDGLRLDTNDNKFKLKIGGRIQYDWAWFDQDHDLDLHWSPGTLLPGNKGSAVWSGGGASNATRHPNDATRAPDDDSQDGAEFRRARVYMSGEVYEDVIFKAQYDFANDGTADFKDVYIGLKDIPYIGTVTVGQQYEPFSLELLTSSNDIMFMERSLPTVLAPDRRTGVKVQNSFLDSRMTAAAWYGRDSNAFGDDKQDGGYNVTTRVTGLPWYEEEGRQLVHLGAAYSRRNPDKGISYSVRPEAHLAPAFLQTGTFYTDTIDLWGGEAAVVYGPFSMQSEYIRADYETRDVGDPTFDSYYVEASYFLTGENRVYDTKEAIFKSVKPKTNFSMDPEKRGWGAWEVAARYSTIDMTDDPVFGGEEDDITLGVNWYLNAATKVMFNYVMADIEHPLFGGDIDTFQTRFQFKF